MTTIALIGNPNSGKSSIFNLLTGSKQEIGNWPGVTVERKSGTYKQDKSVSIQDLPGIYSLSPYSMEERVTRDYLLQTPPDAILDIIDVTNLERSLYLTLQLLDFGIPMVIGLNMMDLLKASGRTIDMEKLSYALDLPVVAMSAIKRQGLAESMKMARSSAKSGHVAHQEYDARLESALSELTQVLGLDKAEKSPANQRFLALTAFESDDETLDATLSVLTENLSVVTEISDTQKVEQKAEIRQIRKITERLFHDDAAEILVNERYAVISQIMNLVATDSGPDGSLTDKIDRFVTSKWLGLPIFVFVMWAVYFIAIQTVGALASNWLTDSFFGQILPKAASDVMSQLAIVPWLQELVNKGIIGGLGAILGFVPQIFVLFVLLGLLEDSGYMARVAFVMDRLFRRFGLSGKSFIPMLIASGCGVPGIMATRTIEQERDRRITIMVTTFMPCSAKLPVIALISGAFFRGNPWIAPSAYFLGMGMIIISGILLKKLKMFAGSRQAFIMELPIYHLPQARTVLKYGFDKAWSFVKQAGTVVFVLNVAIWLLSSYNFTSNLTLQAVPASQSMLASLGRLISWIFVPLGFGDWQATVATFTGLAAKETIVGSFGVLFAGHGSLTAAFASHYTAQAAYAFLVFNLLCAPCIASVATIFREMGSVKWGLRAVAFQTLLAYSMSFIIYQLSNLMIRPIGWTNILAALVLVVGLYLIFKPQRKGVLL